MQDYLKEMEAKMTKTVDALQNEYASIRAGKANSGVLDKISVEYYGTMTPVNQVATISTTDARTLVIQPYDSTLLKGIEKAIQVSDIGINPQNDGKVIRLTFPPLTEERRKELGKQVYKMAEESKVAIRSIRRDTLEMRKAQKKKSEITEDDLKASEKDVQASTDKFCKKLDDMATAKEKEIMSL